jgi:glycosyltransferase involved in cell wall biosynthesis
MGRPGARLAEHYASADIFLFSSVSETFGNVTLEAMASGLAVVAYDYAAAQQFIRHGKNGLLATMNDRQSFIAQSRALGEDGFDLHELRRQARATTLELSWQSVTRHLEAKYRRLVRRPRLVAA